MDRARSTRVASLQRCSRQCLIAWRIVLAASSLTAGEKLTARSTTTMAGSSATPTRRCIGEVFASFQQTGSADAVVAVCRHRRFPARAYGGAWAGQLRYGRLTHSRVLTVLRNPAYAGAYVFGRRRRRRHVEADGTIRATTTMLPRQDWGVVIRDHHPGYISWEQ